MSLVFPLFVLGMGHVLKVDTVDVTGALRLETSGDGLTEYSLELPAAEEDGYDLMFSATGNIVTVSAGDEVLYEYGGDHAGRGRMIGDVYICVALPPAAYERPLTISLRAADSVASSVIGGAELCPHAGNLRYYLTNENYGFPLAVVLLSMAFCIPVFLLLGGGWRFMREGLLFGCILLCFSVLLLGSGGHYLLFSPNQYGWTKIRYLVRFLFPTLFLLYFRAMEQDRKKERLLRLASLVNAALFLASAALGLTDTVAFCDMMPVYYVVLGLDGVLGAYGIGWNLRRKGISRIRRILLIVSVAWVLLIFLGAARPHRPVPGPPRFDMLCVCAVIMFYALCGLFAESAFLLQRDAQAKDRRIEALERTEQSAVSAAVIARALSENYESIYAVDAETGSYTCYYESSAHGELGMASHGNDYFGMLKERIQTLAHPEDREYLMRMLDREEVLRRTRDGAHHTILYRIEKNGTPIYHQTRAVRRFIGRREYILLGIRDMDDMMRREQEHAARHQSMLQKEVNHLEAILASAAGYLEANLSKDVISERSFGPIMGESASDGTEAGQALRFSDYIQRMASGNVTVNAERFLSVNRPETLIRGFERGARRASVSFSIRTAAGDELPCRQVSHLYRDKASGDVMCFSVIYDLTEEQRKEKEKQELEYELHLSRIRTFTGQMQPHFLYNALGSIQEIMLEDPEYASELLGDFTIHLRSSIRAMSSDDPIPFAQELENIRSYVNIERMRFGEKLTVSYEIEAEDFSILPLSIQPLVENAIRHGIYQRGLQGGRVCVRSRETEDAWVIQVEDDGVGFDVENVRREVETGARDSTGLKNLVFRLDKVMHASVDIQSWEGKGTNVTVTVPKGGSAS